ncbi:XdhC family protein [Acetohalobium arabaticum]|uniref:Sulfurylase large subunit, molybdopterin cytosine dinucleotide biosynthesis n=1 Tax=Acetohalobium arabaticum (strain ATCC 49924 / DSM 5501 / Z-7288) TaxID=574087 RepID=D9QUV4_ACEAZ|nr:XdhC family protein [Acetohalobium arabaticum]ADL12013.1 sulfurylase large subunit, molybdopterin cytosine dinucleotide biosynthesis [Acetohalobium arabaticum DSM 5501]
MEQIEFYRKIATAYKQKEQAMIGTITAVKENNNFEFDPVGSKILLRQEDRLAYPANSLELWQIILDNIDAADQLIDLKQPALNKVEIDSGSEMEVYFEPVIEEPRLLIFGAGHVAQSLAQVSKMADFKVTVMDDREDMVNRQRYPQADKLVCAEFDEYLENVQIKENDYLVIVTRGHQHDYDVLREVIDSKARYIGMIGSSRKVKILFKNLQEKEGISQELIDKVYAPIGVDIASETPAEIAISIIAEIISIRRGK